MGTISLIFCTNDWRKLNALKRLTQKHTRKIFIHSTLSNNLYFLNRKIFKSLNILEIKYILVMVKYNCVIYYCIMYVAIMTFILVDAFIYFLFSIVFYLPTNHFFKMMTPRKGPDLGPRATQCPVFKI